MSFVGTALEISMKAVMRAGRCAAVMLALILALAPLHTRSMAADGATLPGTGYEVVLERALGDEPAPPSPALVTAIGDWLSFAFDLPTMSQPPSFRFASAEAMLAIRSRGIASDHWGATALSETADILAIYDDESRTIYLRDDWRGGTAAELSIVVHEMVHHLQNLAGLRFECHEAREKQAFAAQQQWLALFGQDLATEFELDPLALLVRTNCPF
jgi:hypothetical protein